MRASAPASLAAWLAHSGSAPLARSAHGRRGSRSAAGQSLVELALILPFLLTLAGGATDLARVYQAQLTLESAVRNAAEYVAANSPDAPTAQVDARRLVCLESRSLPGFRRGPGADGEASCLLPGVTLSSFAVSTTALGATAEESDRVDPDPRDARLPDARAVPVHPRAICISPPAPRTAWCGDDEATELPHAARPSSSSPLVIPIFVLLLVGTFDLGHVVWANDALSSAAREAARYAIVHGGSSSTACPVGPPADSAIVPAARTGLPVSLRRRDRRSRTRRAGG